MPPEPAAAEARHVDRYGPEPLHLVELYRAEPRRTGGSRGLVILIHGGFWRARWDRAHLRPMATALAGAGYTVALPEFRRVGDPGGGWPGTRDDVRRILRVVPAIVRERFGDAAAERVILVGHSAGGHLALAAASDPAPADARVERIVSLAGVLDLAAAHALALSDDAAGELLGGATGDGATGELAGDGATNAAALAIAERMRDADPMLLPLPPAELVLVHGTDDEVPAAFSRAYAARDPRVRLIELAATGHYELIDPASAAFAVVLAALEPTPGWRGRWIEPVPVPEGSRRPQRLRRVVELGAPVLSAQVRIAARGDVALFLNDRRLDAEGPSSGPHGEPVVRRYDATGCLHPGENVVGVILGESWGSGTPVPGERPFPGETPPLAVLLEIEIVCADGARIVLGSDEAFRATTGAIIHSEPGRGERQEHALRDPGWKLPGFDDARWTPVRLSADQGIRFTVRELNIPPGG